MHERSLTRRRAGAAVPGSELALLRAPAQAAAGRPVRDGVRRSGAGQQHEIPGRRAGPLRLRCLFQYVGLRYRQARGEVACRMLAARDSGALPSRSITHLVARTSSGAGATTCPRPGSLAPIQAEGAALEGALTLLMSRVGETDRQTQVK